METIVLRGLQFRLNPDWGKTSTTDSFGSVEVPAVTTPKLEGPSFARSPALATVTRLET